MPLESATYIDGLVSTNPTTGDALSAGDDHIRLIKAALKASFPAIGGAVAASHTELDRAVDQAGTLGSYTLVTSAGQRDVIFTNTNGTLTVQVTDTAKANPTTVLTITETGVVTFVAGVTGTTGTFTGAFSAVSAAITNAVTAASATLTGALSAASATLTGALSAASAAITNGITAASVTLTGAMSSATATVSGLLTAGSATITGALSAASASISGALSAGATTLSGALSGTTASFTGDVTAVGVNSSADITATGTAKIKPTAAGIEFSDLTVQTTAAPAAYSPSGTLSIPLNSSLPIGAGALVLKAGQVGDGSTSVGQHDVTFATAFPTACVAVVASPAAADTSPQRLYMAVRSRSTTGFTLVFQDSSGDTTKPDRFNWIAIGY